MTNKTNTAPEWVSTAEMAIILGVSRDLLKTWRLGSRKRDNPTPPRLIENVHWVACGPRKVMYNLALMQDFMVNQNRPHLHQKAIEKYLESLPSSKAVS